MELTREELNFLRSFFSKWADPFRSFDKYDINRRGHPFGGPYDVDLNSLIRKKVIAESPDGHKIRLTDFGYQLMIDHISRERDWEAQRVIRVNLADNDEIHIKSGEHFKGHRLVRDIILQAQSSLMIVDPYISPDLFIVISENEHISNCKILTSNNNHKERDSAILAYQKIKKEKSFIELRESSKLHNRYIFVDEKTVYQIGGSIKDIGNKDDTIKRLRDIGALLDNILVLWKEASEV